MRNKLIEVKSATITSKGQIAIPKEIRELEHFKIGSKIAILAYEDRVELIPIEKVKEKISESQKDEKDEKIEYSY